MVIQRKCGHNCGHSMSSPISEVGRPSYSDGNDKIPQIRKNKNRDTKNNHILFQLNFNTNKIKIKKK